MKENVYSQNTITDVSKNSVSILQLQVLNDYVFLWGKGVGNFFFFKAKCLYKLRKIKTVK